MLKLAFRNIFRNRLRTLLTLAAITTGVIAIIISGGFVEDVYVQLRESTIHSRIGHIQVFRQGYSEQGQQESSEYMIDQPNFLVETLSPIPQIKAVMHRVNFSGLINNGRADLPIIGEGIEAQKEAVLGTATTIISGRALTDADTFGAMVGEGVASAMKLTPGSYITIMANTLDGALNTIECEIIGVFRTFSKEYDDRAVRILLPAAQELLYTQAAHSTVILLNNTEATNQVAATIKQKLNPDDYEIKTWLELADFYQKTEALYQRQFGALQVIILVMLILSIANTINMAVYERTGEFGTMLALGRPQRQVFYLVLLENTLLGIIGSIIGIAIGTLLAILISKAGFSMPPPPGSNIGYIASIRLVPSVLLIAIITSTLASILAAILPAYRASKLQIVDALRANI